MEQPKSYIQVIFEDVGSAVFTMNLTGVTSGQLFAVAERLRLQAEIAVMQELEKQQAEARTKAAQNSILVPGTRLPDDGRPFS